MSVDKQNTTYGNPTTDKSQLIDLAKIKLFNMESTGIGLYHETLKSSSSIEQSVVGRFSMAGSTQQLIAIRGGGQWLDLFCFEGNDDESLNLNLMHSQQTFGKIRIHFLQNKENKPTITQIRNKKKQKQKQKTKNKNKRTHSKITKIKHIKLQRFNNNNQ